MSREVGLDPARADRTPWWRGGLLGLLACGVAGVAVAAAHTGHEITAAALAPFPAGAPAGNSGGFGEPTCESCHFGEPLDDPAGALAIEGLPATFAPGQRYRLTIRLRHPAMLAGGFQLTSRVATGTDAGRQAGTLTPVDDRTAIEPLGGVQYVTHTERGTAAAEGRASWLVDWTAPARAGAPVVFHVSGNATNKDESPFGDLVYARADTARPPHAR